MLLRQLTESPVKFFDKSRLRQYIIQEIIDRLEQEDSIEELARLLLLTVGKSVDIDGKSFTVEDSDITGAITEWKASRKLCTSGKPNRALGASALSSCIAQGYRARQTEEPQDVDGDGKREKVQGGNWKSEKYGGPIKDQNKKSGGR